MADLTPERLDEIEADLERIMAPFDGGTREQNMASRELSIISGDELRALIAAARREADVRTIPPGYVCQICRHAERHAEDCIVRRRNFLAAARRVEALND